MKKQKIIIGTAIIWLLLVTFLHCLPGTEFPKISWLNKIKFDKFVHFALFLLMVILWCRVIWIKKKNVKNFRKIFSWIAIASLFYGILMELVQDLFIPFRYFDLLDIGADGIGCLGGWFIVNHWYIKK